MVVNKLLLMVFNESLKTALSTKRKADYTAILIAGMEGNNVIIKRSIEKNWNSET
jgi:hypothetical protein